MYSVWTKHLANEKDKDDFKRTLQGSRTVLNRLKAIMDEDENSLTKNEISPKVFEDPNWAYKQAYANGYRSCLRLMKTLVDIDNQIQTTEN